MQFVLGDTTGRVPAIERQDFKCSACPQVARRVVFSHALVSADELPIATHTEPRAIQLSDTAQRGTPKGREEIDEFVPKKEIEELYPKSPYYIVPDGEVGQQAFAVIREAIRQEGMVAIGKVVFTSREHIIALEARDKGLLGVTLRYPYEVRKEAEYFDDIPDEKISKQKRTPQ